MWAMIEENMNAKSIKREVNTVSNYETYHIPEELTQELDDFKHKYKELES